MATIWLVAEDPGLAEALAGPLLELGEVIPGPPERRAWRDVGAPDLIVLVPAAAAAGDLTGLERLLEFGYAATPRRRNPPGILFVEPASGHPSARIARERIDDRPVRTLSWSAEPDEWVDEAVSLLGRTAAGPSLRERSRRDWVRSRVELLYADLELPALRTAIDPRNAQQPVLLLGERGTGKHLLARYIHDLSEPAREALVSLRAESLEPGRMDTQILELCAGRRITLYLGGLHRLERGRQEELAQVLGHSGLLGIESMRWVVSATAMRTLVGSLRSLPWLRVGLPPLRERTDLERIAQALTQRWAEPLGRELELTDDALAALRRYAWPGNLQELDSLLQDSLRSAEGPRVGASELRLQLGSTAARPSAPAVAQPAPPPAPREPAPATPSTEPLEPAAHDAHARATPWIDPSGGEPTAGPAQIERPDPQRDISPEPHSAAAAAEPRAATEPAAGGDREPYPDLQQIVSALSSELRQPLLAVRACTGLLEQRPGDPKVREDLVSLVETDVARVSALLGRLERFVRLEAPGSGPADLVEIVSSELDKRRDRTRSRSLVVLRELDPEAPPLQADEEQLRFMIGSLLECALAVVPEKGNLYVGSRHRPGRNGGPGRHRLLVHFQSPEDVVVSPEAAEGQRISLDLLMARALVVRLGGSLTIDCSGSQDTVIVVELRG